MKSNIFKFMSVIAYACFIFTLFEIGTFFILGKNLGYSGMIALILLSIICLETAYILKQKSNSSTMIATVIASSGVITIAFILLLKFTLLLASAMFIASIIVSIYSYKARNDSLSKIFSKKKIITYLLIMSGILGYISLFTSYVFLTKELIIAFGIMAVFSMYILNRSMLEVLYTKKSSDTSKVNNVIQKYNFHFITGFTLILVILIFSKDILANALNALGLYIMIALLRLLKPGSIPIAIDDPPPPPPPPPEPTFSPVIVNPGLFNYIAMIVAALIITVILVIVLRIIVLRTPEKIKLIWSKLKILFFGILGLSDEKIEAEGIEFLDELSKINKDELSYDKKYKIYKNYRKVSHIKDPVERMRAFYGYFMTSLKNNNVPLYACDTSYDIYDKTQLVSDSDDKAKAITEIYNEVRYGDIIPSDKMLISMDEHIRQITKSFVEMKDKNNKEKKKR